MSEYTHISVVFPAEDAETLYRASDGMRLAQRKARLVVYGENPHQSQGRTFLDSFHAGEFMKKLARDESGESTNIEVRMGEGSIVIPEGSSLMEFPANPMRKMQ